MRFSLRIVLSKKAKAQLETVPEHIYRKFLYWNSLLVSIGLIEARKYKGFHDEPLKGKLHGKRSVRLSKHYRAIYIEVDTYSYDVIEILEVNKHEY